MQTIHKLFADNKKIKRTVKNIPGGIETLTEASDSKTVALLQEVVKLLQEHAKAVSGFVKDGMAGMHVSHPAPPKGAK